MEKGKPRLTFCGGVGSVTGANFLLETDNVKILVDCGMIQGPKWERDKNREPFPYNPADIDYLFVTHAHADHIGRIGKLVKDGFKGTIYSTKATHELSIHMLEDAVHILSYEAQHDKKDPLYTEADVDKALSRWKTFEYHETIKDVPDFSITSKDAGHILGSCIYEMTYTPTGTKIAFTGDLGNSPTPLLRDTEPVTDADYLVMESVYGDRNHEEKEERLHKLQEALSRIIARGGTCLIPVFSLEKTQVLLHELNDLIEDGKLPSVPVFLDSPLGIKLTEVYSRQTKEFNKATQDEIRAGDNIFDFPKLQFTMHQGQSDAIHRTKGAKIIIASSGMSEGGRINGHEIKYLPDEKNAIIFIGYQVQGSLGRRLKEGQKEIRINKKPIEIKAEIISIDGYSSHKDSDGLIDFVSHTADTVKKVFVVMGEPKSALFLAQRLRDYLDVDAIHPKQGMTVELE